MVEKHETYMQQVYGLIVGNVDERVIALVAVNDDWEEIHTGPHQTHQTSP